MLKVKADHENTILYYERTTFHPKVYLFRKNGQSFSAIVGSSNFTGRGLQSNYEFNILLKKKLKNIETYFETIAKDSDGQLNQETVNYYRKIYKAPERPVRYKKKAISSAKMKSYKEILNKWNLIKGVLEKYNTIEELPFTYVYDAFCHYFKTEIIKDNELEVLDEFDQEQLIEAFEIFLDEYFTDRGIQWRMERLKLCLEVRKTIETITVKKLREFYLNIHSITSGSGSGVRKAYFESEASKREMKGLLKFMIQERLPMEEKYAIGLQDKYKGGEKIRNVGESTLGEIAGWLFPEDYPIINGKFHFSLNFFKI